MPVYWSSPLVATLWQVLLHSALAATVLLLWARRWRLPPGPARRRMLTVILVLPLVTALVPGRGGLAFREDWAWLDSSRLLAIPVGSVLGADLHVYHGVLAVAGLTVLAAVVQELLPTLRRWCSGHEMETPPESLARFARELPGWERCRVEVCREPGLHVSTLGWPGHPRLVLSREVVALPEPERSLVLRHEHAHWTDGRWWRTHLLFVVRLVQVYNPVALWAFREHGVEIEIACDAQAVAGETRQGQARAEQARDPARRLARTLLRFYEDAAGVATRWTLRRRVDVLLGRTRPPGAQPEPQSEPRAEARPETQDPSAEAVWIAAGVLLVTLPWFV